MEKIVCVFVCFVLIHSINAEVLQCPTCTYITSDADIPPIVKTIVDGILNVFQEPKCSNNIKGPISEINEETCEVIPGKVSRCSYYKGRIDVTIPALVTEIHMPLQIYQRGCYHSKPANVPAIGCHKRKDINEDATIIKQFLNKVSSVFEDYELAKFEGEMCLCVDTYCRQTSGVARVSLISPVVLLMVCIVNYVLSL